MNLAFTVTEAGDNTYITITDTTADWEVGAIQDVYDNGAATLNIVISGTAYDAIDVKAYFNGGNQSSLVFVIDPEDLLISGVIQHETYIPDGDYQITYSANHTIGGAIYDSVVDRVYLIGVVQNAVDEEARTTNLNDWQFDNTYHQAMLVGAWIVYTEALIKAGEEGDVANFRIALGNLQIMLANRNY